MKGFPSKFHIIQDHIQYMNIRIWIIPKVDELELSWDDRCKLLHK